METSKGEAAPIIGVSACLLGEPVRYDGRGRRDAWVSEVLARDFALESICPEMAIGLGVPRPPIELVARAGRIAALGVEDPGTEVTDALEALAAAVAGRLGAVLAGYVFKARSPSCGVGSVPLHAAPSGRVIGMTSGRFAAALQRALPGLPVAEEAGLGTAAARRDFLARARDRARELAGRGGRAGQGGWS